LLILKKTRFKVFAFLAQVTTHTKNSFPRRLKKLEQRWLRWDHQTSTTGARFG